MSSKPSPVNFIVALVLVAFVSLSACSATPTSTPDATVQTPTETLLPPATPTSAPDSVWLVAGPDVDAVTREDFTTWLANQVQTTGMTLSVLDSFRQSDVSPSLKAVVWISPSEDAGLVAAGLPQTQFVVITDQDLSSAANLNVIKPADDQAAFLSGYLATLNAPDFRSGALLVEGAPQTARLQEAFLNGGRYFCGRCAPVYAPIVIFPVVGLVPANADAATWQAAFDALNQNTLEMLYLPPQGFLPDFLTYLNTKNVKIISSAPPPDGFDSIWAAAVHSDSLSALKKIWPEIMAGSGGKAVSADLVIDHVNSANLSLGRQQLTERLIPDLLNGIISPLSVQ